MVSVFLVISWGLDVALGKEWTSIKLYVLIFLSLISFKFVLLCFLINADKNNWLFCKNNWLIFWNYIKNIFVFAELISTSLISHWLSIYLQHLRKIFHKQFTTLLFKASNSNNWHHELVLKVIQVFDNKILFNG